MLIKSSTKSRSREALKRSPTHLIVSNYKRMVTEVNQRIQYLNDAISADYLANEGGKGDNEKR